MASAEGEPIAKVWGGAPNKIQGVKPTAFQPLDGENVTKFAPLREVAAFSATVFTKGRCHN